MDPIDDDFMELFNFIQDDFEPFPVFEIPEVLLDIDFADAVHTPRHDRAPPVREFVDDVTSVHIGREVIFDLDDKSFTRDRSGYFPSHATALNEMR